MREIKFRAWDEKEKEMFTPDWINNGSIAFPVSIDDGQGNPYTVPNAILMQYTGLKDKNGKEIYEGDIVKTEYYDVSNKCWVKSSRPIKAITWKIYKWHQGFNLAGSPTNKTRYEIIGNIYENPELLK